MEISVLGSSSRGNSTLIKTKEGLILVDMGLSYSYVKRSLSEIGEDVEGISALVLTHEHTDHIRGVKRFHKLHPSVPIYGTAETLWFLGVKGTAIKLSETFSTAGSNITPFKIPHDAMNPVGYEIQSERKRVSISLDMGSITGPIVRSIRDSDFMVVEANHNIQMLRSSPYPYPVKQRIANPWGHLSNRECGKLLKMTVGERTEGIILAHLSTHNNSPKRALTEVVEELTGDGERPLNIKHMVAAKPRGVVGPFRI